MADVPLCPATGEPMVRDVRPVEISYRGRSRTVAMPGWFCDASGESIHSREDMIVSDAALTALKAEAMDLAGPDEIRRVRQRLGLSQAEADRIVADEPGSFAAYEGGRRLAGRPLTQLLRLLVRHPDEIERLRGQRTDADRNPAPSQSKPRKRKATTINP